MIKREAFSNKIKQLTYSFLYAHFSFLQTKISKIAQTTRGNRRIYLIKAKPQICSDLQGNKMCLPSKSLPKLRLIYILWRMSSLHKSFPFYMQKKILSLWNTRCCVLNAGTKYTFSWTLSNHSLKGFDKNKFGYILLCILEGKLTLLCQSQKLHRWI